MPEAMLSHSSHRLQFYNTLEYPKPVARDITSEAYFLISTMICLFFYNFL
jgi:hypothetical protein